jgi:hypothetical protein
VEAIILRGMKKMGEQYCRPQLTNSCTYLAVFHQNTLKKNIELSGEKSKMYRELIK